MFVQMASSLRWKRGDVELFARTWNLQDGSANLPIVIVIHGLTMNSLVHVELCEYLASLQMRVVAVDVRGRGLSGFSGPYALETYADDIIDLCDNHLHVEAAIFIGTSMGGVFCFFFCVFLFFNFFVSVGLISLNIARRRPSLVGRAVLNDIGPEICSDGLKRIGAYLAKQQAGGGAPRIDSLSAAAAYFKDRNGSCMPNFNEWEWFAKCLVDEEFRFRYDPAIALPVADPHAAPDWLWACLDATKKVLVIRGAISDILSKETAEKMAERGCKLLEVQGIGHTPLLTEPECKLAIAEFLK